MNKTFKQLLEIAEIKSAQGKIEELDRFLDITRGFSLKCNAHLRVLTNLVNNLVESEDWLELADTALRLPESAVKEKSVRVVTEQREETKLANQVVNSIREDYEKISKHIESGKQTSDFLKELMEKLLKALPGENSSSTEVKKETTITKCMHQHCHANCPPGCTQEHNNHHAGSKRLPSSHSTKAEQGANANQLGGGQDRDVFNRNRENIHNAMASHSIAKMQMGESQVYLRHDASLDPVPRVRLSIQSDNKGLELRSKQNNLQSVVRKQQERILDLEKALKESNDSLRLLQAEVLQMKIEKDVLEDNVRELISWPLVRADRQTPADPVKPEDDLRVFRSFNTKNDMLLKYLDEQNLRGSDEYSRGDPGAAARR